ncbi:hypothetical protein CERZMDRAFT_81160 [Cercospora zeae-maydis SCOH1-5]|uniref:AA1-like domain-containing protein n=1 Tax=Cercospora zeae-maydis SCOH1-5 TaxID=717836 RepID=A0A6A6FV46_9PEZI|nr:hypothetical protein CERZMDRAFT_81160 [Cercospora zeae-maydis SCOH1-5]
MKNLFALFAACVTTASAYSSFVIPTLTAHQPIGSGSTNFYLLSFDIKSDNSGNQRSAFCQKSWGDNGWTRPLPYSLEVPTGQWIKCDSARGTYDGASAFSFQLYPYFSIGNFSLSVKEDLREDVSVSGFRKINNGTEQFTCDINPAEVLPVQHAHGDCSIPEKAEPFQISVSQAAA